MTEPASGSPEKGYMIAAKKQKLLQAFTCLMCALVLFRVTDPLQGTEFAGGTLTGKILTLSMVSIAVFLFALVVTFFAHRFAALIALAGCILGLPLYLYLTAPGPFRGIFKGEYSVPLRASFEWDTWAVVGIFMMLLQIAVLLRSFSIPGSGAEHQGESIS